jgi:hypothetical protein
MNCEWTFAKGPNCGATATVRTAGGLYLCADHLTDWARGVYRPCWVDLATGLVSGGVTHGQTVSETSK